MKMPTWPRIRWRIFAHRYSLWDASTLSFAALHAYKDEWPQTFAWLAIWLIVAAIIEKPWRPLFARPFNPDDPKPEA